MRHTKLGTGRTRRTAALALTAAVVAAPLAGLASPAFAADAPEAPAITDKTLTIFDFGATFGIPTGCQLLTAAALSFAGENGFGDQASPVVQQINDACDQLATAADNYIQQGKKASQPLAVINQFANPAIGQFAAAVSQLGTDNSDAIAPFGKTVAGLGGTINFFQGEVPTSDS